MTEKSLNWTLPLKVKLQIILRSIFAKSFLPIPARSAANFIIYDSQFWREQSLVRAKIRGGLYWNQCLLRPICIDHAIKKAGTFYDHFSEELYKTLTRPINQNWEPLGDKLTFYQTSV